MTKRLQVLLEDSEWREVRRAARAGRLTVAEWVRQALRQGRRGSSMKDVDRKLEALRAASRHGFPTADVDQMHAEIVKGYLESSGS